MHDILVKKVQFGIGTVTRETIDEINIHEANMLALKRAIKNLPEEADYAIVDGHSMPNAPGLEMICMAKADEKELCVAAASIIAKVKRDRMMREYDKQYPGWGFAQHNGYGTKQHRDLLRSGKKPTPIHRRSFNPLKSLLLRNEKGV